MPETAAEDGGLFLLLWIFHRNFTGSDVLPTPPLNTADCPCTLQYSSYYFRSHPITRSCFLLTFFLVRLPLSSSSVSNFDTQRLIKNGNNNFFAWIIDWQMTIRLFDLETKHCLIYIHKYLGITFDITYFTVQKLGQRILKNSPVELGGPRLKPLGCPHWPLVNSATECGTAVWPNSTCFSKK